MKDEHDKSPDNRARAEPDIEKVDQSEVAKGTGENDEGKRDAEWGERIETGKTIARGGKTSGEVPGATPQRPKEKR
ncbi:MAG: hypothetical protein ACTHK7_04760 [Aureliella sp.]